MEAELNELGKLLQELEKEQAALMAQLDAIEQRLSEMQMEVNADESV
jgi:hypothetical protein